MAKAHAAAIQNRPALRLFRLQPAVHGGYQRLAPAAQQTGQQAYSQYLSELSALIPELEKQARSRYGAKRPK